MQKTVRDTALFLVNEGFMKRGDNVLDIGCGNGRFARTLKGSGINYTGLDCIHSKIISAMREFSEWPEFKWFWLDVRSKSYNSAGSHDPATIKMPFHDGTFDAIICHSLFTHLGDPLVASNYMDEITRLLKPNGKLWITFFQSPPNEPERGTARTVYSRAFIDFLLIGYKVILKQGGLTTDYNDQVEFMLEKK